MLVGDGTDATVVKSLRTAVAKAGATLQIVAPKIWGREDLVRPQL